MLDAFSGEGISWARKGWWSQSTLLGRLRTFRAQPPAGQPLSQELTLPIVAGEVNDIGGGTDGIGPPMLQTFSLTRLQDNYPVDPDANWDLRARITSGAGAVTHTIECDWMHGTQICLPGCGQVSLAAVSYAPDPERAYSAPAGARTTLGTAIGSFGHGNCKPRLTQRLPVITPTGSSAIISPPQWAESLQVYLAQDAETINPYANNILLDWVDSTGFPFFARVPAAFFPGTWFPIPAGGRVRVLNAAASNVRATLVWRLCL